jgi:phage repressor protein C with HTH and peptisase S24 domain
MFGFTFFKIKGDSMSPKIPNESYVLSCSWFGGLFLGEGKKILVQHHSYGLIVKTVALVDHHGFIWVKGENNQSMSVEQLGPISANQVIGRVLSVFAST